MDRRKKYFMVVDVETAGGLDNPLVYDIGFAITDKKGTIYDSRSFIIAEIFNDKKLMRGAYYASKIPQYEKDIIEGKRQVVNFLTMRDEFLKMMNDYNVKTISAYNLKFDTRALSNTVKNLYGKNAKFLTIEQKNLEMLCIWSFACEVLYTQATFKKIANTQNWLTEKGNMKTSAEIGHRYLSGNYEFEENHTGIEDVEIEIGILAKCFAQHKKHESGVLPMPWKIPNMA